MRVTLVDRNNYHQFQPLLYQVATSQLAPSDIAYSAAQAVPRPAERRRQARRDRRGRSRDADGDLDRRRDAGRATRSCSPPARGPNFFRTSGRRAQHAFPLYTLDEATRLRSRIIGVFEDADREPGPARPRRAELRRRRRRRRPASRSAGRARGPDPRHDERRVPRPRGHGGPHPPRRPRPRAAGPVLRAAARLRRQGAAAQGRPDAPRRRGHRDRRPARRRCPTARRSRRTA